MASKYRLTVNLSESEYLELVALSERNKVSMAWLGRKGIMLLLDNYNRQAGQLSLLSPESDMGAGE